MRWVDEVTSEMVETQEPHKYIEQFNTFAKLELRLAKKEDKIGRLKTLVGKMKCMIDYTNVEIKNLEAN